jgi:hypothetical protein
MKPKFIKNILIPLILVLLPIQAYPLSFCFYSYSKVEGFVRDSAGNPICNVEIKGTGDCIPFDIYNLRAKRIIYHTFSDSSGHFEIELIADDGESFNNIESSEQILLCKNYMNKVAVNPNGSSQDSKIGQAIYKRKASLIFDKIGYFKLKLDAVINCRMDSINIPNNSLGTVYLKSDPDKSIYSAIDSKYYFNHNFNEFRKYSYFINSQTLHLGEKFISTDSLFDSKYNFSDIRSLFRKSNKVALGANLIGILGIVGGIVFSIPLRNQKEVIYPIISGITLWSGGLMLNLYNIKYREKIVKKYNSKLLEEMLNTKDN